MGSNDDQHDSLIPWFNTKEQEHRQAISYFQLLASTITIHIDQTEWLVPFQMLRSSLTPSSSASWTFN